MDRHSRQLKGTKWKWTDIPDSRRGQSGNGQTLQTVKGDKVEMPSLQTVGGDKVEMDRHYRQSKETKWKWTDTPDNRKGRSGNAQTLQTVEGDKVEMDRHSVAMELCSGNELKVQIYKGQ